MKLGKVVLAAVVLTLGLAVCPPVAAQTEIEGASNLLNQTQANQLGTWLGQGGIKIERIFSKSETPGADAAAFHAAVDGQGPTFSVWTATGTFGTRLVGGYNPQSWMNSGGYNFTVTDDGRKGFIFDLTAGVIQRQDSVATDDFFGQWQTFNDPNVGPAFGAGYDLVVGTDLNEGGATGRSFNGLDTFDDSLNNLFGLDGTTQFQVGDLEVFAITPAVPEPASALLLLPGLVAAAMLKRRRSRRGEALG